MELSVVIAVKNGEKYIAEQLRSIQAQTYKNFECVIIDDYSTDNTVNIVLEEFCKRDNRFKLYANLTSASAPYTYVRTHLYEYCSGTYIISLDCDDICLPTCFEALLNAIKSDSTLDAVSGRCRGFYINPPTNFYEFETSLEYWKKEQSTPNEIMQPHNAVDKEIEYFNLSPIKMYTLCTNIWCNQCYIIKRTSIKDAVERGLKFEPCMYAYCDYVYWLNFLSMGYKVKALLDLTVYYRLHNESITHTEHWKLDNAAQYKIAVARTAALETAKDEQDFPYFLLCYNDIDTAIDTYKATAEYFKNLIDKNEG